MKEIDELKNRIRLVEDDLKYHKSQLYEILGFKNIKIKECETCGHETVHLRKYEPNINVCYSTKPQVLCPNADYFLCTVCGSTTKCVTKTVCEPYTPIEDLHCCNE